MPTTYSTSAERKDRRSHIPFRTRLERSVRAVFDRLPEDKKRLLGSMPWLSIAPRRATAALFVVYAIYKLVAFCMWMSRRLKKDYDDHAKDNRYARSLLACSRKLNERRWLDVAPQDKSRLIAERRVWLGRTDIAINQLAQRIEEVRKSAIDEPS